MRLAVEQPDRVARLVILNTGVGGGRAPNDVWLASARSSGQPAAISSQAG